MTKENEKTPRILIVDDLSVNVKILENIIQAEGYEALCALSVQEALDIMKTTMPDLILSDYSMPGMDGMEFCKLLKSNPRTREIPFIFITVANSKEDKKAAFEAGAVDFIPKPFERVEVVMRVNNQLTSYRIRQEMEDYNRMMHKMVEEQKRLIQNERERVLLALAGIVEKRNQIGDGHLERMGHNCYVLAQSLQLIPKFENKVTDEFISNIEKASVLHDIGNILMSDEAIAKMNGEETDDREILRIHTEEGARILEEINGTNRTSSALGMAIVIAKYQHANWDGSGYPENLKGEDIPLEARITAVSDAFDGLLRRYGGDSEEAVAQCVRRLDEKSGTVYDPAIIDVFHKVLKQLKTI